MIPITSPEILGKVLRKYRKEKKLSQSEAGKKFNITQKTVSLIESGKLGVRLETLFNVMSALELEMHITPRQNQKGNEKLW